jgi:hypothetical protein
MANRLKLNEKTVREAENLGPDYQNVDTDVRGFQSPSTPPATGPSPSTTRLVGGSGRLTVGRWPEWSTTAARERTKELRREIDAGGAIRWDRRSPAAMPLGSRI